ncbi:tRNA dihydrouridine synthase [Paraliomyxa miuraensis]|uniref:tRNA dihydrouridine synthase n=1 Tax=Paraliomyxa miuraensis TaxID=376150 RepID=UPI002256964D|nr:tRNA-dihydrouridine synthase family protein [Paraliomyxa miuraensis]MCX4241723.1 tRNA-dihydrouridine synthase family protein [Paraliomyxa miuraensis]
MSDAAVEAAFGLRHRAAPRPDAPGLFLALAPMDGVTDWVYRDLLTSLADDQSGISLCVSEFVRVTRDRVQPHVLRRICPELDRGGRTRAGVPVFVQLLGGEPEPMAGSAALAAELGAPGIDINFGCPAKTVNNHDGGATILKTPCRIESIVGAVRRAVPASVPVTVKIRLGWDGSDRLAEIAAAAEAGGAEWLTIHARTRLQLYRPPVAWDALAKARLAVRMPVVANGDLCTEADLRRCAEQSGCHAFMIGRGAMGRPWLFRQARGLPEPDYEPVRFSALLGEYAARLLLHGAGERAALGRLKQWLRLGAPAFAEIDALFQAIKVLPSLPQALARLQLRPEDTQPPPAPGRRPRRESSSPAVDRASAPAP